MRPRRPPHEVVAAWILTGPIGHLYAGVADWAGALISYVRAREQPGRTWRHER